DRVEHGVELGEAVGDVAPLIAMAVAAQDELAVGRDARRVALDETLAHVGRDRARRGDRPAQHGLGIDLVDVLAARARAADEADGQLASGNARPRGGHVNVATPPLAGHATGLTPPQRPPSARAARSR